MTQLNCAGAYCVAGSPDGRVSLWDVAACALLTFFDAEAPVLAVGLGKALKVRTTGVLFRVDAFGGGDCGFGIEP